MAQKTEAAANSVVVLAAAASNFVAGSQTIGLGTSLGGNQKMKHRKLIEIAVSKKCPLVIQPDAVGNGATTTAPVGDYFYRPQAGAGVTALLSRGAFAYGSAAGAWYGRWWNTPSYAYWAGASRSLIRNPFGGTGVATPVTPD